jgi:hypothetical protein
VVQRDGTVDTWVIEGGWRDVVRHTLSDVERKMPIANVLDHEHLSAQIAKGWTPENDSR